MIAPTVVPTPSSRPPTAPPTPFNNPPSALPNPFGASAIELVCTALTPASTSLGLRSAASTTWPSASTRTPPATLLASDAWTASGASGVTVASAISVALASTSAAASRACTAASTLASSAAFRGDGVATATFAAAFASAFTARAVSAAAVSRASALTGTCTVAAVGAIEATALVSAWAFNPAPLLVPAAMPRSAKAATWPPGAATRLGRSALACAAACTCSAARWAVGVPRLRLTLASTLSRGAVPRSRAAAASATSASSFTGSGAVYLAVSACRSVRVWFSPAHALPVHRASERPSDSTDIGTFRCTTTGPAARLPRAVAISETTTRAFSRWLHTNRKIRFIRYSPVYECVEHHRCLTARGCHYSRGVKP